MNQKSPVVRRNTFCGFPLPPIRLAPEVYRNYRQTIAIHEPETYAILGGYLEDPFCITDFRFCPPRRDTSGELDASATHINIDDNYMNWVVDEEWKPQGKYLLGVWHSHPRNVTRPSTGDAETNTGDIAFFTSCLEHDDSPHRNWRYFLAPITTFNEDGNDRIHGWVLEKGSLNPRPASIIIDPVPHPVCLNHTTAASAPSLPPTFFCPVISEACGTEISESEYAASNRRAGQSRARGQGPRGRTCVFP